MKKLLIASALIAMSMAVSQNASAQKNSAGSGQATKEVKAIPEFSVISLSGTPNVEYRQSKDGSTSVSIHGPEEILDYVEVSVADGTLYVGFRRNTGFRKNDDVKVIASGPSLNCVWINGSGSVDIKGGVSTDRMEMLVAGSGNIYLDRLKSSEVRLGISGSGDIEIRDLDCTSVLAVVEGSGDIFIDGKANYASYLIGGSGGISARNLSSKYAFAHVNGTGNIACDVQEEITGYVKGTGKIYFTGNPSHTNISGTGSKEFIKQR